MLAKVKKVRNTAIIILLISVVGGFLATGLSYAEEDDKDVWQTVQEKHKLEYEEIIEK